MAKLGEVCLLKAGKFVSANDISPEYNKGLYPCFGGNGIRGYVADYTHDGEFPLIGRQGALCGNVNLASGKFHATEHAVVVQPKIEMNVHWLYYALNAMNLGQYATGAAQPGLAVSKLETLSIEIPNISEQNKIAQTLYKVEQLVNFRRQQLAKLDELVKARFVEMFGNPIENTMNWPKKLLRDITTKIGSGATPKGGRESYPNAGVSLIRSMNVYDGQFLYKDLAHLTDEQATQLNGVTVEAEDVLVNITGASVARSCVVPKDVLPARVNQHVAIVRCNRELLNPIFTNKMFINNEFKKALLSIGESGGATRQAITKKQLEELSVVVPPLSIQNEFFTFSERVDQQKQTVQQSLDKLELMKKALMQEYFG